jgi:hypothetical protein
MKFFALRRIELCGILCDIKFLRRKNTYGLQKDV